MDLETKKTHFYKTFKRTAVQYRIIAAVLILYLLIVISGNVTANPEALKNTFAGFTNTCIYENSEVVNLMNSSGTEQLGTITVTKARRSACREEALVDWYFYYVREHSDSNYHIIVYTDDPQKGVYTTGSGCIQTNVSLVPQDDGTYLLGDDTESTYYTVNEYNKTLNVQLVMADAFIADQAKAKVEAVIPEEYKEADLFSIDFVDDFDSLECSLTLVNDNFDLDGFPHLAQEIATRIKELDMNIGNFCISFQGTDDTVLAISTLDDLRTQKTYEITTKKYAY